jgi:hypothetical protein
MADAVAPKDSDVYRAVRDAATQAGVGPAFQDMCMLLKAPPSLSSFILVVRNIKYMLTVQPNHFQFGEDRFPGWTEMTEWAWENQDALIELAGEELASKTQTEGKSPIDVIPHPMQGVGLTRFPIYSALCNSAKNDKHEADYARLQAQLLMARRDELKSKKVHNSQPYIDLYERYAGKGDFAEGVREPNAAARAVRGLSDRAHEQMLAAANGTPEAFVKALTKLGDNLPHTFLSKRWLDDIRNYCGLLTSARPGLTRTSRDSYGGGPGVYGYVEYNDSRFGIEFTDEDEDDDELNLSQELIFEHSLSQESAHDQDAHRGESVHEPGLVLQGNSKQKSGGTPGRIASARTNVAALEIDKDRLPWSAIHLRPKEIGKSLLKFLALYASGRLEDKTSLDTYALIAVCLETGRPLQEAMKIRVGNTSDGGDFLFIPARNQDGLSHWSWRAIEPVYAKKHSAVKELEVERVSHLRYPVHPVANHLLRKWSKRQPDRSKPLFLRERKEYEERIKSCLRGRDKSGRLTLSKVRQLKWSLLSQESGGDIAAASLVLGLPHPLAHVSLFYSLLSTEEATDLFDRATLSLWTDLWEKWNKEWSKGVWPRS